MLLKLNVRGNLKQLEACRYWLDNETEEIYYGGAKGAGKSFLGVSLIFGDAFIYPGTHYFIARKDLTDLRKFTIPSIHEVLKIWGITENDWKYNGQDNFFQLANGSRVYLLACTHLPSDPLFERFGSMQMTRGMIEEAGEVSEDAKKALWLSIGRWMNEAYGLMKKLLCTMNPKKNWIYRDVYKPFMAKTLRKAVKMVLANVEDNMSVPEDYKRSLRELTGIARQRLFLGNWEYDDSDNALISYDAILDCFNNSHILPTRQMYITADIALEGSDHFTIVVWDGFVQIHIERIAKSAPKEVIIKIEQLKNQYHVPNSQIVYDADGLGTYVGGWVVGAKAFHNGARPVDVQGKPENYKNLKTQCYYRFAKRCTERGYYFKEMGGTDPATGKTLQELCTEEMEQIKSALGDKEGKLQIIAKDEVKANIGRSPDITDSLMMREYFELSPKPKGISRMN